MKNFSICLLAIIFCLSAYDNYATAGNKDESTASITNKTKRASKKSTIEQENRQNISPTPVLGFQLRQSSFEDVKRELQNYQYDPNLISYANGPILSNDGSGFDIEGIKKTEFVFNQDKNLVAVFIALNGKNHYEKLSRYLRKRGYKVVRNVIPFVGSKILEMKTRNNETIIVSEPHLDFSTYVSYMTNEFIQQRSVIQQQEKAQKEQAESKNF